MQARAIEAADGFIPQNVANFMWALATLGRAPKAELVRAMSRRSEETAGDFRPQAVANLLWALATVGVVPGQGLLRAMARQSIATAQSFKPQVGLVRDNDSVIVTDNCRMGFTMGTYHCNHA
jgi:hypothetical protein